MVVCFMHGSRVHLNAIYLGSFWGCEYNIMLCGGQGDKWPTWCLMGDEVDGGDQDAGLFRSLFD